MRENARPPIDLPRYLAEGRIRREINAIKLGQPPIQIRFLGQEELPEVGIRACEYIIEEEFQRSSQVGGELGIKTRKAFRIFREILRLIEFEPCQEKLA